MTGNLVTLSLSKSLQNPSCSYSDMNNQGKYHIETCSLQSNGFTQKKTIGIYSMVANVAYHLVVITETTVIVIQ